MEKKAVLFADICGSTSLYEALGDGRAFSEISDRLDRVRKVALSHVGLVLKNIGDEIMCIFPDAILATQAAARCRPRSTHVL